MSQLHPDSIAPWIGTNRATATTARNDSGVDIASGDLVYVSGLEGTKQLEVTKADADQAVSSTALLLVANQAIPTGRDGFCVEARVLTDVVTTGATIGDPVYLSSTAGGWTLTAPEGYVRQVGQVVKVHASAGVVLLWPTAFSGAGATTATSQGERILVEGGTGTVTADMIVVTDTRDSTSGLIEVEPADADSDALSFGRLLVALTGFATGEAGLATPWKVLTSQNTAAGAAMDPVFLSGTAGGWTLTPPATRQIIVGLVLVAHASTGVVLLCPGEIQKRYDYDGAVLPMGKDRDLTITADGANGLVTNTTGSLVVDNTAVTGKIGLRLGTDTTATAIEFRNNSDAAMWSVIPASATAGTLRSADAGVLAMGADSDFTVTHDGTTGVDVSFADNDAEALTLGQGANRYLVFDSTNDKERVTAKKIQTWPEITVVDMADAAHALVLGTAGAGQTKLVGNMVYADANSSGFGEILTLPTAADCDGLLLVIRNTGGELLLLDDAGTRCGEVRNGETGVVFCNGTAWASQTIADRCVADIAVADVSGGGTDAALTVDLYALDALTVYAQVRQIMIIAKAVRYEPLALLNTTTTFGTATKGSIIQSGNGWCLAQTNATGEFDCTASNSADETVYFEVITAQAFATYAAAAAYGVTVVGSNSDSATWSA